MKTVRLYIPLALIILSILLLLKASEIRKQIATISVESIFKSVCSKHTIKEIKADKSLSQEEIITAKQIIEALAYKNKLPVKVRVNKNRVLITSFPKYKDDVLSKYANVLSFISSVSNLPYKVEVKRFCYGIKCSSGFLIEFSLGRKL